MSDQRLGMLLRSGTRGLSTISLDFWHHIPPAKALVCKFGDHVPDLISGPNVTECDGTPKDALLSEWLDGLDVVLAFETPYNWKLFELCRARGIRSIMMVDAEYLDGQDRTKWSSPLPGAPPDLLWMPVDWYLNEVRSIGVPVHYCPMPVDRERFKFRLRTKAERFVAALGAHGDDDRPNANVLLRAITRTRCEVRFDVYSIDELPRCYDSRVTMHVGTHADPAEHYADGDVFLHPRRYAGMSLPMNEALSCGLPVVMSDMKPQSRILPRHWLVPCESVVPYLLRRPIEIGTMSPDILAEVIDRWAGRDLEAESRLAGQIAQEMSWEALKPSIIDMLAGPAEVVGRKSYFIPLSLRTKAPVSVAYLGNFSQRHCTEVHIANSIEALGHKVVRIQEKSAVGHGRMTTDDVLRAVLKSGAKLFLYTRTWSVQGEATAFVDALHRAGVTSAAVHLDLYLGLKRATDVDRRDIFWALDYTFTADGGAEHAKEFKRRGINHVHLSPGIYDAEAYPGSFRADMACDVAFVGTTNSYHEEWPFRGRLLRWLRETYGARFQEWGSTRSVRNQDLNDLYASAKVVIGDSIYSDNYWSDRVFETTGRGGFLINPRVPGLERYFTLDGSGCNLVTYDNKRGTLADFSELQKLIDYYLEHDAEREAMRRRTFEHVRRAHSYMHRIAKILEVINAERAGKSKPDELTTKRTEQVPASVPSATKRLSLGCGHVNKGPGWTHVDAVDFGFNIVADLDKPFQFKSDTFDFVEATDVIEHLNNPVQFVNEMIRVLKPGGSALIQAPNGAHPEFWCIDLQHRRGLCEQSLDYWVKDSDLCTAYGLSHNAGRYFIEDLRVTRQDSEVVHNLTFTFTKAPL